MNIRSHFPFFDVYPELAYLDNASTTQKPWYVIKAIEEAYIKYSATPYRGIYTLAEAATEKYEAVRSQTAHFIGACEAREIAFVANATAGINTIVWGWAAATMVPGDEIVLTELEHHANILPWQRLAAERGFVIKWLRVNFDGSLAIDTLDELITSRTKIVALTAYSNVLGSLEALAGNNALEVIVRKSHAVGARVLLDAAQYAPYYALNVSKLGVDFAVMAAHKMLGPGVGILYAHKGTHTMMVPHVTGGGMVETVDYHDAHYRPFPYLFEAGTQSVPMVLGWGVAMQFYKDYIDFTALDHHCRMLINRLVEGLSDLSRTHVLTPHGGGAAHLVSFYVDGVHAHDVAAALNTQGICVRAGNHCASILHAKLGIPASVRISVFGYNTVAEIDHCIRMLRKWYA